MHSLNEIEALKRSDETTFKKIFFDYHQKIYFYIVAKTRSNYLAEEVTQLTFIKLWNYRSSISANMPLSGQLFRIAITTLIDLLRKNSSQSKMFNATAFEARFVNNVPHTIEAKELQSKLDSELKKMPPMRRKVFQLSRFERKSHREISQMLSVSEKTVENHISLAIKQLRRVLPFLCHFLLLLKKLFS